jgi:hypothetical protein
MATYTIIGGDQKPYSSVTPDDIRRWIADGRLNAQSLAREENDTEWRPLSAFPEFADVFAAGSAPPPPLTAPVAGAGDDGHDAALQRVKGPAIALKVTAILNIILAAWSLVRMAIFPLKMQQFNSALQQLNNPQLEQLFQKWMHMTYGPLGAVDSLFGLGLSVLILIGAARMQSLRSYEFALTAAILAMVPCLTPCCLIGLPFGIWAVVVLSRAGVKSQFH